MSDVFKNKSVNLTTTGQTVVYTVPTADVSTTPPQKPVQAIVKSIRVANILASAAQITIVNADKSLGPAEINLETQRTINGNTAVELLVGSGAYVLEDGDILKATASAPNHFHIPVSVLEISS